VVNVEQLTAAAELGVVFLLLVISPELEPRRLWAMRRALFGLGTLQAVITGLALSAIGLAVGWPAPAAFVLGLGLALSSTAFAILLLQDIAVVPLLAMVPLLAAGSAGPEAASVGASLEPIAAAIGSVVLLGTLALPRVLEGLRATSSRRRRWS
jgi:Kef-type K+ transport system membrane component KefB